jgi:hypothetical protein
MSTMFVEIKPLGLKLAAPQGIEVDSLIPSQVKCLFFFSFSIIFLLAHLSLVTFELFNKMADRAIIRKQQNLNNISATGSILK